GIIATQNEQVRGFKGLHVYHSAISNCSMRVCMTLEEKGLPWTSHHLDLAKHETHTPEYFSINPNGVVPTLVHDGVVIIESDDIIEYIDERFPDPPLVPNGAGMKEKVHAWVKLATGMHIKAVKTFIYENRVRGMLMMSDEMKAQYRRLQTNPALLEFHAKASSSAGFSREEIATAGRTLQENFSRVDAALGEGKWIAGDKFSLADIAWVPLHFTLIGAGFSFDPYPRLPAWADANRERPGFQRGILKWCPKF
ncbi:MAG: glutathione S-transferase family protein, partial [Nitrospiraceae bacterium]